MARAYGLLGNFNSLRPEDAYPKEKDAALKALEIDGSLAEARAALGWAKLFYDRDWDGAREEFQRAVDLNPNLASAHQAYATYFVCMGQFDRAESEILKAQELDPINLNIKADVGWYLFFARRNDEAIAQLKQVVQMDPNFSIAHTFLAHAYQQKEMFDEAIREAQKAMELLEGSEHRLGNLGDAYARAGKKQEARSILARLKEASRDHYVSPYQTGLIYASLGQPDEALDWLERAYQDRYWMIAFLKVDPRWDSLRSHPRFIEILRRTGLASKS
jgi:tetratricopeptide (TPR) repeat protein